MIVQCADCKTRYQLDAAKVPQDNIRVRCPRCSAVFRVDGRVAAKVEAIPTQAASPAPMAASSDHSQGDIAIERSTVEVPSSDPQPAADDLAIEMTAHVEQSEPTSPAESAPADEMDFEIERSTPPAQARPAASVAPAATSVEASSGTALADAPAVKPSTDANLAEEKSRRLARALVSDILVYNRDARDRALEQGNIVQSLGQEIKKSWELYKERVTPEMANSNNHFREALNEILADGQQIF
jgi:predicted Zn finger-like uncharacterized protein